MANSRSRKSAPTRPGTSRDQRPKAGGTRPASRAALTADDPADQETNDEEDMAATKTAAVKASASDKPTGKKSAPAKSSSAGSSGRRFGDGETSGRAGKGSPPTKSSGRGRRGSRPAPAVRVGTPRPWGMIAATVAVVVFAVSVIGYAVFQANSTALPDSPADIDGISILEYTAGQEHVTTNETYTESPPVGGPHDGIWADCDGAIYDMQVRSENAVHSLEHGGIWLTYNPDISDADLSVLSQYVQDQPYIFMSPYAGLKTEVSLQSWNHQLFLDSVDDSRINDFIQVLRQNPEEFPEVGASCTNAPFLADPVIEGEQSRAPGGSPAVTDAPTTPTP